MIETSGLEALSQRRLQKVKDVWVPPARADFRPGLVLAFDQSLAATGFVVLEGRLNKNDRVELSILESEVLKTTDSAEGKGGHAENLRRARDQYHAYSTLLRSFAVHRAHATVAHEAPPDGGGRIMRPESSLLAALALEIAAEEAGFREGVAVASATHRKLVCGRGNVTKKVAHTGLAMWAPALVSGYSRRITNEALRDGLSVALAALHRAPR